MNQSPPDPFRSAQTPGSYSLTASDLIAFAALLQAQNALGPPRAVGQDQLLAFYGAIDTLSYNAYSTITNTQLHTWVDLLYPPMINTQSCYGISAAGMYAIYCYARFVQQSFTGPDYEPDNTDIVSFWIDNGGKDADFGPHGFPNAVPYGWFAFDSVGMWRPPGQPDTFYQAIPNDINILNAALQAAHSATRVVELFTGCGGHCGTPAAVVEFERARFSPTSWTDSTTFVTAVRDSVLWQQQLSAIAGLLQPTTLSGEGYLFLLHLLIGLAAGGTSALQRAQQLVSTPASSTEYPNDTFVNQLVYLVLLYLADPGGPFAWSTAELTAQLSGLSGLLGGSDPASQALQASLTRHLRVLQVDTAYPLQDPYCPSVGFPQRQADTLFALDKARASLR